MKKLLLFSLSALVLPDVSAQSDTTKNTSTYLNINYDNDLFVATDRYYTQGIYIELIAPFVSKSPISHLLIRLNKGKYNYSGLYGEQDVFTPRNILHDGIYFGERPYCGAFFLSQRLYSFDNEKKSMLYTSMDIGFIGPAALGEQEQKGIHHAINNVRPRGWENQLSNDVIINYDVKFHQGLIISKAFELEGTGSLRVGTFYDNAGLGIGIKTGRMAGTYSGKGMSGEQDKKNFRFVLFADSEAHVVGYDATLQGGIFAKDIYSLLDGAIERFTVTAEAGIALSYEKLSLEYSEQYITAEFSGGLDHGWGHCALKFSF